MLPSEFSDNLIAVLGDNLISVTLFGLAAKLSEEELRHAEEETLEYPLLLVLKKLDRETYSKLSPLIKEWLDEGNPMPMVFSADHLAKSADSFPVEVLDMKECRKVIYGSDSILPMEVKRAHFQQELINTLKSELLRLRSHLLEEYGDCEILRRHLLFSYSSISLLLRSTLRLFVPVSPSSESKILETLKIHLPIEPVVFLKVQKLRLGKVHLSDEDINTLYFEYLIEVEKLADGVDAMKIRRQGGATYPPFKS